MQDLIEQFHANARAKGFWDFHDEFADVAAREMDEGEMQPDDADALMFLFYGKQFAMIHSEVTEMLEALRKQKGQQEVEEEAADIFIRLGDLYEGLRTMGYVTRTLEDVVRAKAAYNESRPRLHGNVG